SPAGYRRGSAIGHPAPTPVGVRLSRYLRVHRASGLFVEPDPRDGRGPTGVSRLSRPGQYGMSSLRAADVLPNATMEVTPATSLARTRAPVFGRINVVGWRLLALAAFL